jgi:hypothetical protein
MAIYRDYRRKLQLLNTSGSSDYNLNCVVSPDKPKLKFCITCSITYITARIQGIQYHLENPRPLIVIWFSCPDCLILSVACYSTTCADVCVICDIALGLYTDLTHMLTAFYEDKLFKTA